MAADQNQKEREDALAISFNYSRWKYPIENKNTARVGKDPRKPYVPNKNRLIKPGEQFQIKFPIEVSTGGIVMEKGKGKAFNTASGAVIENDPPLIIEDLHPSAAPAVQFASAVVPAGVEGDVARVLIAIESEENAARSKKVSIQDEPAMARILGAPAS
jgi:hypothetical protein